MKAVILAGGEGTRLRPLTCNCPKPMARLCGRPVLEYILELLSKNGVNEAYMTLRYLPQDIRNHFPDEEYAGVKLRFVEEDKPLGTAGGVKNAVGNTDEDIIVISGDAMCDFNLTAAVRFHRDKSAAATLLMSHVGDPREYGLIVTEPSGKVRGFVEKPGWAQAVTDAVNTGIYILSPAAVSMIPDGKPFDFAKDLFARMVAKGMPLYGFDADGYWCDIGDIGAYESCQFDMLEGKLECKIPGLKNGLVYTKTELPAGNYTLRPPVYIGENVKIGDYAQIGPFAVLDDGATVGEDATVKNSIVLEDAYVGERCELRGALVCAGASLKKRAGMFEGSVAGAGSVIGRDAAVSPGVKIWPGKKVEDGARAAVNLKFGAAKRGIFDDEGVSGEIGVDLTPEICAKIGAAAACAVGKGKIGVADDGSAVGKTFKNAVAAGAVSAGTRVFDFGSCFETELLFASRFCALNMGIMARCAGSRAVLILCDGSGLPLKRNMERKIDSVFATGEIHRCEPNEYDMPYSMTGIQAVYENALRSFAPGGLAGIGASVRSSNKQVQRLLSSVLRDLGCGDKGVKVHITASGRSASFFDENGNYINAERTLALGCAAAFENGSDVAVPFDAPRAIDLVARKYAKKALRYLNCPVDAADAPARLLAGEQTWVRDGVQNTVAILALMKKKGMRLADFAAALPKFAVAVKAIPLSVNPGKLLRQFAQEDAGATSEGVLVDIHGGKVLLCPLKRGTGLRIEAEASSMETADELCVEVERQLRGNQALDRKADND